MPGDQDETDALFGSTAPPPPPPFAGKPGVENRKETRVRANWQARVLLPGGQVVQLNLFDLSESGVGLAAACG
jgi:hypothetical protein